MKYKLSDIKILYNNKRYTVFFDVGLFIILIFSFHFLYLWWSNADFWPIKESVDKLFAWASSLLFDQSCWILEHIFNIDIVTKGHGIGVLNHEGSFSYVIVAPECTSLKQWLHWIFLMLLFPGPWKHKLWYIPAGIVVIEWINVIRIVGLTLVMIPWTHSFDLDHNYIFKTFFYFMIFIMWVIWVEFFLHKKHINNDLQH